MHLKRNKLRAERIKEHFLNLFKTICGKYNMQDEIEQATSNRKKLLQNLLIEKGQHKS